jgi:hypothetical protein
MSLMSVKKGIPTPFPTVGRGDNLKAAFVRNGFIAIQSLAGIPDFGRFYGSRGGC